MNQEIATNTNTKIELTNSLDNTKINIYPNPVENILNIDIVTDGKSESKVHIYSVSGQLLITQTGYKHFKIDISSLGQGIYIVKTNVNNPYF